MLIGVKHSTDAGAAPTAGPPGPHVGPLAPLCPLHPQGMAVPWGSPGKHEVSLVLPSQHRCCQPGSEKSPFAC